MNTKFNLKLPHFSERRQKNWKKVNFDLNYVIILIDYTILCVIISLIAQLEQSNMMHSLVFIRL